MKSIYEKSDEIVKDLFNQGYKSWGQNMKLMEQPENAPLIGVKRNQYVMYWEFKKNDSIVTIYYIFDKYHNPVLPRDADYIHIYYEIENKLVCLQDT
jgi:hypothetical protein